MDQTLVDRRNKFPPGTHVIGRKRDFPSTTEYTLFRGIVTNAGTMFGKYMVEVAEGGGPEIHIVALHALEQLNPERFSETHP